MVLVVTSELRDLRRAVGLNQAAFAALIGRDDRHVTNVG